VLLVLTRGAVAVCEQSDWNNSNGTWQPRRNYIPFDEFGPENWALLDLGEGVINECGRSSNSPIDFVSVDMCTNNTAGV